MKILMFDFDGVIVNTFDISHRIINLMAPISADDYRVRFEGNIHDASKPATQHAVNFFEHYTPQLLDASAHPEIISAIRKLAREFTLVIISSSLTSALESFLAKNDLRECFQEVLGADIEKSKVKKIRTVLEKYQALPSDALFITDTLGDIREASECAVESIAVKWGFHAEEVLLRGNPYRIIERENELLPAIHAYFNK